jgi:hypothetical protein
VSRVALVTATAASGSDEDETPLLDALIWHGVEASVVAWDDRRVDWSSFDLVVVRSTWDYVGRFDEFVRWLRRVAVRSTLANALDIFEWNLDKSYLRDLQRGGVAVVPTTWIDQGDVVRLPDRGELVVKPTVSAGAKDTTRYVMPDHAARAREHIDALLARRRAVMVQPYIESVDEHGEVDLIYVDGVYSHAVRKGAILREPLATVEPLFAAENVERATPTEAERALADRAMALVTEREPVLYARVDVVTGTRGEPMVLEVELCEPALFLRYDEEATERFANAIGRWASR